MRHKTGQHMVICACPYYTYIFLRPTNIDRASCVNFNAFQTTESEISYASAGVVVLKSIWTKCSIYLCAVSMCSLRTFAACSFLTQGMCLFQVSIFVKNVLAMLFWRNRLLCKYFFCILNSMENKINNQVNVS